MLGTDVMSKKAPGAAPPSREARLENLYRTYSPDALRLAYLLTGDRSLAEDLAQEAFVRVLGRFTDLRSPDAEEMVRRRHVAAWTGTPRRGRCPGHFGFAQQSATT